MNLIIDVGNSRIKTAVFKNSEIIYNEVFTTRTFMENIFAVIDKYHCVYGIIASVGSLKKSLISLLKSKIKLIEVDYKTKIPFENAYKTPKTLGVDRIALVAAAFFEYPKKNVLIIDAGTCITYDFINEEGVYLGGAISPGIQMRYKALHHFTEKLPLLNCNDEVSLVGNTSEKSIHSGIINGVINEIDGFVNDYRKKNKDLTIVLTGGDVNFLANRVKNSIFANPNFLLQGLNTILTYNI